MATITKTNKKFSDLDMMFKPHPITGDIVKKIDEQAVKQSVKTLISLSPYDVPFHPEISCQVRSMLFELPSPITAEVIKTSIIQVISKFEPRISLFDVTVYDLSEQGAYQITVEFLIVGSDKPVTVNTLLYRSR